MKQKSCSCWFNFVNIFMCFTDCYFYNSWVYFVHINFTNLANIFIQDFLQIIFFFSKHWWWILSTNHQETSVNFEGRKLSKIWCHFIKMLTMRPLRLIRKFRKRRNILFDASRCWVDSTGIFSMSKLKKLFGIYLSFNRN